MKKIIIGFLGGFSCLLYAAPWQPLAGDLCYNEACFLTSHNSYAAVDHGYYYAQQSLSIKRQLEIGVRGLMLDTAAENGRVLLCHNGPFLTRIICRGKEPMPLIEALSTIPVFLKENPHEVVTIFLENYVKEEKLMDASFREAQLESYILRPCDWNPQKMHQWPTFAWMRTHNKRLVIFNSLGETDLFFDEWGHVIENQWGTLHPARACKERPESRAHKKSKRSLYLVNYFPSFKLRFDNAYESINSSKLDAFLARALKTGLDTSSDKGQLPTFLCLDFVDKGNGMTHVMAINSLKQKHRRAKHTTT